VINRIIAFVLRAIQTRVLSVWLVLEVLLLYAEIFKKNICDFCSVQQPTGRVTWLNDDWHVTAIEGGG
jgi:hypothetical protein